MTRAEAFRILGLAGKSANMKLRKFTVMLPYETLPASDGEMASIIRQALEKIGIEVDMVVEHKSNPK